jgi:ribosomal 30S subunit maturation factor RimM
MFDITKRNESLTDPVRAEAGIYYYPQVVNVPVITETGKAMGDVVSMDPLGGER